MAPFASALHPGTLGYFLTFFLLGLAFGAVLEASGFGDSRKLSAQFYLRDLAVLKVMFTGIIVAAVLVHLASAFQLLDISRVWINPTYLVPGIVGGLIMGVGFIIGGFCPGTSLVAAGTLKLDGVAFVLGGLFGVFAFGETVGRFDAWWHSTFMGRFTVSDWLHLPTGVTVLLLVLMALGMFVLGERAEARFGSRPPENRFVDVGSRGWRRPARLAAGVLAVLCLVLIVKGQPSVEDRWSWLAGTAGRQVADREIFVDPAEVVELRRDLSVSVRTLELRSESDYNLFHLAGSERIDRRSIEDPGFVRRLLSRPDNAILFLAANGETPAVEAWKRLKAQGVLNVYVIEGGINRWLEVYPPDPSLASRVEGLTPAGASEHVNRAGAWADEPLACRFRVAVGERSAAAHPDLACPDYVREPGGRLVCRKGEPQEFPVGSDGNRDFVHHVKLQKKTVVKGGCG